MSTGKIFDLFESPSVAGQREQIVKEFGSHDSKLLALHDRLKALGVTEVALEMGGGLRPAGSHKFGRFGKAAFSGQRPVRILAPGFLTSQTILVEPA